MAVFTSRQDEVKVTHCCPQKPYLELRVPAEAVSIRKIRITLSSRDQGFCDDQGLVGKEGYTWFELNVETSGRRNNIPRRCIYRNPAGVPEWSDIRLELDCTHEVDGFRDFATKISPHDIIQLIPRAQFNGWMNFVCRAELEVEYSTQRPQKSVDLQSTIQYQELDKGELKSTRLLNLQPGKCGDSIIVALTTCRLNPDLGPELQYEALSYCWGDLDDSSKACLQVLEADGNTAVTYVSRNLFKALVQLRSLTTNRLLWIDQICINQADKQELSEQVGIMGWIYSQATRVVIWLGEGDPRVEQSIDTVNRLFPHFQEPTTEQLRLGTSRGHLPNVTDGSLPFSEVSCLLSLPWFWRVWVVQEAVRAFERTFIYGERTVGCDVIQKANMWSNLEGFELPSQPHIVLPSIWSSLKLKDREGTGHSSWHTRKSLGFDLLTMFIRGLNLRASDPRDHIFGLFGLSTEARGLSQLIIPDYSKSVSEVFVDFTLHYVRHDLRVLSAIHALRGRTWRSLEDGVASFPSASPDRTCQECATPDHPTWALWYNGRTEWADDTFGLSGKYHVTGDVRLQRPAYQTGNRKQLTLLGHSLGQLNSIGPYHRPEDPTSDTSVAFSQLFNKSAHRHYYDLSELSDPYPRKPVPHDPRWHWFAHHGETGLPETLQCANDCYFRATNNLSGLCPSSTRAGDVVVILFGGPVPYLIRETEFEGQYTFVGECFLEGKMDQNLLLPLEEAGAVPEDFILV